MYLRAVCSAVSRGAFALFAETSPLTVDAVESFSQTLAVPLVTPSAPVIDITPSAVLGRQHPPNGSDHLTTPPPRVVQSSADDGGGYVLFMEPPYHRALADVIRHYQWPRVYYVYDNSLGRRFRSAVAKVRRRENGTEANGWIKLLLPITNRNPER